MSLIAQVAKSKAADPRLKWISPVDVKLEISAIVPDGRPKQTVAGRQKRFRKELLRTLALYGCSETTPNRYRKNPS